MVLYKNKNNKKHAIAASTTLSLVLAAFLIGVLSLNLNVKTYAQVTAGGTTSAAPAASQSSNASKSSQAQNQSSQSLSTTSSQRRPSSTSVFRYPSLVVITHVNNTKGVNVRPDNFTQVVTNTYRTSDGYAIAFHLLRGSDIGININLRPGTFAVTEPGNSTTLLNRSFSTTYSGDCIGTPSAVAGKTLGVGLIRLDESKTCIVTKTPVR